MSNSVKKILLFGASGQLGSYLEEKLSRDFEVMGVSRKDLNIKSALELKNLKKQIKPDIIINCVAYMEQTNVDEKENLAINYKFVKRIRSIFKDGFMIHISSERVYEPSNKANSELDFLRQSPKTPYGFAKNKADKYLYKHGRDFLVIRPSWLHSKGGRNFITKINGLNKKRVSIVTDDISKLSTGKMIFEIIERSISDETLRGFLNIGSTENISRYDLYSSYVNLTKKDVEVIPVVSNDINVDLTNIQYLYMDISKYEKIFGKHTVTDLLKQWIKEEEWKQ